MHFQTHTQRLNAQTCSTSYISCSHAPHASLPFRRRASCLQQQSADTSSQVACRVLSLGSPVAQTSNSHPAPDRLVVGLNERIPTFASIPEALAAIRRGEVVVVLDDEDRENEGDLIMAADLATPETLHFIIDNSSGVVCVGMEGADLDRLRIPLMVDSRENDESMYTAFTVTVDLREGTSTGISAADRALTIRALADANTQPQDLRRPGHIFPLRARPGGVLTRPGHTEASVDLSRLAGCSPAGVMCEVVNKNDGSMARTPELLAFAAQYGLCCVTIADLIRYRLATETLTQSLGTEIVKCESGEVSVETLSAFDGAYEVLLIRPTSSSQGAQQKVAVRHMDVMADVFGVSSSSNSNGAPSASVPSLFKQVASGDGVLLYVCPQRQRTPPEHLAGALSRDPCGGPRALEMALIANILREQLGDNIQGIVGVSDLEAESLQQWQALRKQCTTEMQACQ